MTLPALPQITGNLQQDFAAVILYLQRIRDSFPDAVSSTPGGSGSNYTDENAQDAVGGILQDTTTVNATYDDATPFIKFDVLDNSSNQKLQVSKNGSLVATRKEINLIEASHSQLVVADDVVNDQVNVTSYPFLSRRVLSTESFVLPDTFSAVIANYYRVDGILQIQGDATLRVS